MGAKPALPNAQRYVRRYITPEKNPLTGEVIHPGYDCIMEIWWNCREDFEAAMKGLSDPAMLPARSADELKLFATNSNPVVPSRNVISRWVRKIRFPDASRHLRTQGLRKGTPQSARLPSVPWVPASGYCLKISTGSIADIITSGNFPSVDAW